jgi:hypothetical protein
MREDLCEGGLKQGKNRIGTLTGGVGRGRRLKEEKAQHTGIIKYG